MIIEEIKENGYTIFKYFAEQHDVILLESDIHEVCRLIDKHQQQKIYQLEKEVDRLKNPNNYTVFGGRVIGKNYLKNLEEQNQNLEKENEQLRKDKEFYSNQWEFVSKENKELKDDKIDFAVWYSGMDRDKVKRAYCRYLNELKN
jgi:hypothetical protein